MDVFRIEDACSSNEVEMLKLKTALRRCLFYKEEICTAPKIRFETCRSCCRIDPRLAVRTLFEKIKSLAENLFNLPAKEPEQFPPE